MAYNHNNKVDKAKLLKAGFEGFALLDGKKRQPAIAPPPKPKKVAANAWPVMPKANACIYQYQPPQTLVYQVPVPSTEEMVNCYEAMKLNDGRLVMDYSKRKSAAMAY